MQAKTDERRLKNKNHQKKNKTTATIAYNSCKMPPHNQFLPNLKHDAQTQDSNHSNQGPNDTPVHIPVLLEQTLHYLQPRLGESYLDATAGYGGHAAAVLSHTQAPERAVLVDRDEHAITALAEKFAGKPGSVQATKESERTAANHRDRAETGSVPTIRNQDFYQASQELLAAGATFDLILADLGVSSPHLNHADRGFSLSHDGPLDMRMDHRQALTAADVVNSYSADELADILYRYGEEPKSRQIAQAIVKTRHTTPFTSTVQLARVVSHVWPGHSKVHPATRTFQALRIAVNDELRLIERSLPLWIELLAPKGRLVVISFHSLEDRLVKQAFAAVSDRGKAGQYDAVVHLLTKRPVTAEPSETVSNPRARSAKLRAVAKI
jgi:16S rRNA (cytosine1402-N4)-methyltransferase